MQALAALSEIDRVRKAASVQKICRVCRSALNTADAVLVVGKDGTKVLREIVVCGSCWDKVGSEISDAWAALGGATDMIDCRGALENIADGHKS